MLRRSILRGWPPRQTQTTTVGLKLLVKRNYHDPTRQALLNAIVRYGNARSNGNEYDNRTEEASLLQTVKDAIRDHENSIRDASRNAG